ncbi:GntR family transcriptional regulator [Nonomuraea endophytica]|uniref:GntR family transcriptional regulator n=1 Tax=Nonomuraea endophytica TaxID=714136 RepID=UPI0037CB18EA
MLKPRGPRPLYAQLADVLRKRIDDGDLMPGSLMPSEADLMREFGVARITARRAIQELREADAIYTIKGEGSYVGPKDAPKQPRSGWMFQRITDELAAKLSASEYEHDVPLPSETQLAQEYGVAKGTVRRALDALRGRGLVYTVPGRGTYPSPPSP